MIGMVLVTHGQLATEFRAALEHVVGPQEQLETITIGPEDDMETRRKDIMAAVCRVNSGDGVVVLTDMFGGTPSNLALSCMNGGSVEVVAGINLPMLIKLASVRDEEPWRRRLPRPGGRAQIHQRRLARALGKVSLMRAAPSTRIARRRPSRRSPGPRAPDRQPQGPARPRLGEFVQTVERFDSDVTVTRCGETVGGRSIMGLLTLAAAQGTTITVTAKGPDAEACLAGIADLLANRFGEDE